MKETQPTRNKEMTKLNDANVSAVEITPNDIRYVVPNLLGGMKLVAWFKNGSFVWICKGYTA